MPTPRKPTHPTTSAVDTFCAQFDQLFNRHAARTALRAYLIGLVLPREHNKALTVLASFVPGSNRPHLHHFRHAAIPFRSVVADCVYGEHPTLEARLWRAAIPYVLAIRPSRGTWQLVEDAANPPAFTPHEAALRHPLDQWQRTVRRDSHGKELVRYVAELALPPYYGPDRPVRLIAA